jgi:hypothetical protein
MSNPRSERQHVATQLHVGEDWYHRPSGANQEAFMIRLLGIVAIYVLMFLCSAAAGRFLLDAPVRAGNLIHDSFGLIPQVRRSDHVKKVVLRKAELGLLALAVRFALKVVRLVGQV